MGTAETDDKSIREWISLEEKELVKKLRERVCNDLPTNELEKAEDDQVAFLLRWLRARELDLDKAEDLLRAALKWRKENNVDKALSQEIDPFWVENYRWRFVAADWEGRPVGNCPFYEWDFRKAFAANKDDQFDFFVQYFFETIMEQIQTFNKNKKPGQPPVTQFSPIFDVQGYAYGQLLSLGAMRKFFQMATCYEAYYPEVIYRIIFVNCPGFFQIFINMLKGFLVPRTMAKITCYSNVDDWRKEIDKLVDPSLIPEQFGGTWKTDLFDREHATN